MRPIRLGLAKALWGTYVNRQYIHILRVRGDISASLAEWVSGKSDYRRFGLNSAAGKITNHKPVLFSVSCNPSRRFTVSPKEKVQEAMESSICILER